MKRPTNIYACNGRPRPTEATTHVAQSGWRQYEEGGKPVKVPVFETIPHRLSTDCRYDASQNDPKCQGCGHRNVSATPRS